MRRGASRRGKHGTEPKSKPETTRGSENRLSVVREAAWDSHLTVFGSRVHELSPSHGGSTQGHHDRWCFQGNGSRFLARHCWRPPPRSRASGSEPKRPAVGGRRGPEHGCPRSGRALLRTGHDRETQTSNRAGARAEARARWEVLPWDAGRLSTPPSRPFPEPVPGRA